MRHLLKYVTLFVTLFLFSECDELFPEKKITNCFWSGKEDKDGDGYISKGFIIVEIKNKEQKSLTASLFVKKVTDNNWTYKGGDVIDWNFTGVTFFIAADGLTHGEYDFRVDVLLDGVSESSGPSEDSDMKGQKIELPAQDTGT